MLCCAIHKHHPLMFGGCSIADVGSTWESSNSFNHFPQPLNLFSLSHNVIFFFKYLQTLTMFLSFSLLSYFGEFPGLWKASIYWVKSRKKLSAMDVLARASMKDAAKCDTHCELQISVNHQISERIWRCRDFPAARLFQCLLTIPSTPHDRIQRECHKERDQSCFTTCFYFLLFFRWCGNGYPMGVGKISFFVAWKWVCVSSLSLPGWMALQIHM